ncbi:lysylphosphatidylglycerol synthase transmembrane domain-containing protein [Gimesia sp.]|uniref:lysylphosphatidylglycerol synthase transmembrane domain-containing protein n=1 Tax=Gimesia sp. TaxID=2024833 RepID=UPI003A92BADB
MSDQSADSKKTTGSALIWKLTKWGLLTLVLYFVWQQGSQLYEQQQEAISDIQIRPTWLILSGVCYFIAWLPSVWFWQKLMLASGEKVDFWPTARAYYCGHLGKYIPGKVTVLLIRATLLKEFGVRMSVAAVTAAYETLAVMGVGLVLFLALIPFVINTDQLDQWPAWVQYIQSHPLLVPTVILIVLFVSLPLVARLLNLFSKKFTRSEVEASSDEPQPEFSLRLLYAGVLMFLLSWSLHGLSLGLTLASISDQGLIWQEWPRWMAAVSAAYALGFLALFAPAGLGVREGLISAILAGSPVIGDVNAFVTAILVRIVSFASELLSAFVLYYRFGSRASSDTVSDLIQPTSDTNKTA